MKNLILYFLLISIFFVKIDTNNSAMTYQKGNKIMDSSLTTYYLNFWKKDFLSRNKMSLNYFDTHISNIEASSYGRNRGISFQVNYTFTLDWAKIDLFDSFLVKLSASEQACTMAEIPRDKFLDTSQLQIYLKFCGWGSEIYFINAVNNLKFPDYESAVKAFQDSVHSNAILPDRISFYVPGKFPRNDGYPYFIGFGMINKRLNECITGYFNLVTGEFSSHTTPCVIN